MGHRAQRNYPLMPNGAYSITDFDHDDDLLEATRCDRHARLRVYPLQGTAIVLGQGSRPELELNIHCCLVDHVPILRRRGGGCAVVLDSGNVVVTVALPAGTPTSAKLHFNRLSDWLIAGLTRMGIPGIHRAGICDLVLEDRKVCGACIYHTKEVLLYSASVLVNPDLENVARYLKHPPREPDYRHGRPHHEFMGALAGCWAGKDANAFAEGLGRVLHLDDLPPLPHTNHN